MECSLNAALEETTEKEDCGFASLSLSATLSARIYADAQWHPYFN